MNSTALTEFVVTAKQATYVGDGSTQTSTALGSHELTFADGDWRYRDSYFGGTDFLGQEVVWFDAEPVWAMNYYGVIVRADLIDATRAGRTIKEALSALYLEGRFLGGWEWRSQYGTYRDRSDGDVDRFTGHEVIEVDGVRAYELSYHGGLIKP